MRVVHLVDYIQPKLGYQEYFLAKEHARMGHDVTVVASDRYYPFPHYRDTAYPILGKRVVGTGQCECDGFRIMRLPTSLEIGTKVWLKGLGPTITNLKPDVVICHGITTFNALRIAGVKKKLGFRLIYDDHTLLCVAKNGITGALFYGLFNFQRILRCADRLIGVADECVEVMCGKYGLPREAVEMIPLGADTERFTFERTLRRVQRGACGISDEEIVIVYTGKLVPDKGPHNIFAAIKKLRGRLHRAIVLFFVGDMPQSYRRTFNDARSEVEGFARVIVMGAVANAELPGLYCASDIGVWPRQASCSMIEASSCELPIICCDYLIERYKNGNGIPVREDDIEGLSAAIVRLVNDAELRRNMGKRGRELVERELSWRVIARRFLEE